MSPIFTYTCKKCGHQLDKLFLTYKESEERKNVIFTCDECGGKTTRNEVQISAKFMGTFGEGGTAPSKRHSYKKINKNKTNQG